MNDLQQKIEQFMATISRRIEEQAEALAPLEEMVQRWHPESVTKAADVARLFTAIRSLFALLRAAHTDLIASKQTISDLMVAMAEYRPQDGQSLAAQSPPSYPQNVSGVDPSEETRPLPPDAHNQG